MNLLIFLTLLAPCFSSPIELSPSTFKSLVLAGNASSLIDVYAPWCSHCTRLAPIFSELAAAFAHTDRVAFYTLDGDKYRELGEELGVESYPALRFFPEKNTNDATVGEIETVREAKTLDALASYVSKKIGVPRKTDVGQSFLSAWDGDAEVAVFADSRGPYERLAQVFMADKIRISYSSSRESAAELGLGFPAVATFRKGRAVGYTGAHTHAALTSYLNKELGTDREADGMLGNRAGRVGELDGVVRRGGVGMKERIVKVMADAHVRGDEDVEAAAKVYLKVAEMAERDGGYVEGEIKRLERVLKRGLKRAKADELVRKVNVLRVFWRDERDEL